MHFTRPATAACGAKSNACTGRKFVLGWTDPKLDAMQTTSVEPEQTVPPTRAALAIGKLDRQHLAAAVPVDADGDQRPLAHAPQRVVD